MASVEMVALSEQASEQGAAASPLSPFRQLSAASPSRPRVIEVVRGGSLQNLARQASHSDPLPPEGASPPPVVPTFSEAQLREMSLGQQLRLVMEATASVPTGPVAARGQQNPAPFCLVFSERCRLLSDIRLRLL